MGKSRVSLRDALGLAIGNSKVHVQKVGGSDTNFYPISVGCLLKLRGYEGTVSSIFTAFLSNKGSDTGQQIRDTSNKPMVVGKDAEGNDEVDVFQISESSIQPIDPEMAAYRDNQRKEAISEIFKLVTGRETQSIIYGMVRTSMKDSFRSPESQAVTCDEFFDAVEIDEIIDIIKGIVGANEGKIPFLAKLGGFLDNLMSISKEADESEALPEKETEINFDQKPS